MISVSQAKQLLIDNSFSFGKEEIELGYSSGRFLIEDIPAPVSHPLFDQTAVDGYAFRIEDLNSNRMLKVIGEIQAGETKPLEISEGKVVRIFTGAIVPQSADSVVMQEHTQRSDDTLEINNDKLSKGANIRRFGEQIKEGEIALESGTQLNDAGIGFLRSLGIEKVAVGKYPKVEILVTGNEFAKRKSDLELGKIFESNGIMLQASLQRINISSAYRTVKDDLNTLRSEIEKSEQNNNVIIITGGVSVGDYDFTRPALEAEGYDIIFHKIKQKPGKPMLFARKGNKLAFGMPGNPRSVLMCFYQYVLPYLLNSMGSKLPWLKKTKLPISRDIKKPEGKTFFLTGKLTEEGVYILGGQGSHMMKTFALADGLVVLPESEMELKKGDLVQFEFLP